MESQLAKFISLVVRAGSLVKLCWNVVAIQTDRETSCPARPYRIAARAKNFQPVNEGTSTYMPWDGVVTLHLQPHGISTVLVYLDGPHVYAPMPKSVMIYNEHIIP